ncbi:MAG TPA: hypothetical protein VKZ18_11455 [Polyangia bacterium]|nr:hypothetical protein [Polyangia bacterium]
MPNTSPPKTPKYLMCARALALATGLGTGLAGCGASLTSNDDTPRDATPGAYDGSFMGVRTNPDAVSNPPYDGGAVGLRPYDGGCIGVCFKPDAHVSTPYDGAVFGIGPVPHDGGAIGVRINPDAAPEPDAGPVKPYDGGFFGLRINPDAKQG